MLDYNRDFCPKQTKLLTQKSVLKVLQSRSKVQHLVYPAFPSKGSRSRVQRFKNAIMWPRVFIPTGRDLERHFVERTDIAMVLI